MVQFGGIGGMLSAIALIIYHPILMLCGILGTICLLGVFLELKRLQWKGILFFGMGIFILGLVNYFIYYTKIGLVALPLLQKISFMLFFVWILWLWKNARLDEE